MQRLETGVNSYPGSVKRTKSSRYAWNCFLAGPNDSLETCRHHEDARQSVETLQGHYPPIQEIVQHTNHNFFLKLPILYVLIKQDMVIGWFRGAGRRVLLPLVPQFIMHI